VNEPLHHFVARSVRQRCARVCKRLAEIERDGGRDSGVARISKDVVAYFTQHKAIKGSPDYQTSYHGAIYYFSSAVDLATAILLTSQMK
jgi:hypothetical protein